MKYILLAFLLLSALVVNAQYETDKRDNHWQLGFSTILDENGDYTLYKRKFIFDFSGDTLQTYDDTLTTGHYYANAGLSSKEGNLLFFSNGCKVSDKYGEKVSGLDSIGWIPSDDNDYGWEGQCGGSGGALRIFHGAIMLPLGENQIALLVQYPKLPNPITSYRLTHFFLTRWEHDEEGNFTQIISKNEEVLTVSPDTLYMQGQLAAVRHGNGIDWWVMTATKKNNKFELFLLDETNITRQEPQDTGTDFGTDNGAGGGSIFTPDGTQFISYGVDSHVKLYDFDRCTGELTNPYFFHVTEGTDTLILQGGAVSAYGRFLYICTSLNIFQYDLWSDDIAASQLIVAENDGFGGPNFPHYFSQSRLAPDGRIYITPPGGRQYLHYIEHPDSLGVACSVQQHAIYSPTASIGIGLPNLANYNLGRAIGSPCDSLFTSPTVEVEEEERLVLIPNPATASVSFETEKNGVDWQIFSLDGKVLLSGKSMRGINSVDVSELTAGIYFFSLRGAVLQVEKLVIQK